MEQIKIKIVGMYLLMMYSDVLVNLLDECMKVYKVLIGK